MQASEMRFLRKIKEVTLCNRGRVRPGAPGRNSGAVPPKSLLVPPKREFFPPSEDCAPKKVTGWVPLECSSRLEIPKILIITPEIMGKNQFFADSVFFSLFTLEIEGNKFLCITKNCLCPPVTLLWRWA